MHSHSHLPLQNAKKFAWLSIAAAIVTITLKLLAWQFTGSVGLLSDALESGVNLVAAIVALIALTVAAREPDEEHAYGHGKAEYFSSGVEGGLIILAAVGIFISAIPRLIHPQPLEQIGIGLAVSVVASIVNALVGWRLLAAAKQTRSIVLKADAEHLFTDVWTSIGVIIGVLLVSLTGWNRLDAVIAIAIGVNICFTGYRLVNDSIHGLLDTAIPAEDLATVEAVLNHYSSEYGVVMHALRSRESGTRRFVSFHVLVPGKWSVRQGHDLVGRIEHDIREALPETTVFTHLEPIEEPESWNDTGLDGVG
ncbi:MAG: cation transporter [Thermomicrobiales bacterium]|nr:cation transporter [Thermomicrobiales bacterium]